MRFALLLLAAGLAQAAPASSASNFYLKDGDRVVFYGDSITYHLYYAAFVEAYVATRFPRLHVRFVSSGVGGDKVSGGPEAGDIDLRLRRDVVAYRPTVVTIMLAGNDAGGVAWNEALFKKFSTGYEHILDNLKQSLPGARITLIQHVGWDDVTRPPLFEGGYNAVIIRYNRFVKELGERRGLTVVDFNGPEQELLRKAKAADPAMASRIVADRGHPGPGAHLLMAKSLLKAWNGPATVAAVEIDAGVGRVVRADNAEVSDLRVGSGVTWTETDGSLAMQIPEFDDASAYAIRNSGFVEELDQEPLKVTNLAAGRYSLAIDGETVGDFTKEQLRAGINLAKFPTPMSKQALDVYDLTMRHKDVHSNRWRMIQIPLADYDSPHVREAIDALDRLEDEIIEQERARAQPKPRHFALAPE
ncbi:MAG: SGNH/GDSL hydrolase family protein [Elusimicrobiota bacterium]